MDMLRTTIDIQNELKKSVFGQDELIRSLSVIAWTHEANQMRKRKNLEPINNKTLIIGTSGTGKTYSVKKLAELLNVPFIEIDCSKFAGTSYVGCHHVYDMFNEPIARYGKENVEKAIVFLDEFDKTLDINAYRTTGSRFIQRDFLKLFDKNSGRQSIFDMSTRKSDSIDTTYITFICAGSFYETMDSNNVIDGTVGKMGFGSSDSKETSRKIEYKDLIAMGHLPELMGRFSRIVNTNELSADDIYNILKNGDSEINIYIDQLKEMGIKLEYSDAYYKYLAESVSSGLTGFRDVDKLICNDIDVIISRIGDKNISRIKVEYKDNTVCIKFLDSKNKAIDVYKNEVIKNTLSLPQAKPRIFNGLHLA